MIDKETALEILMGQEKLFIEAGKLAADMKERAKTEQKYASGIQEIDIVTDADIAVQEFLLKNLAKTGLVDCQIVAEESTPGTKLFAKRSDLVLTIDPIDGTKNYAAGKKMYSLIITLHNKINPLYTFDYFPDLGFGIKIVDKKSEYFGTMPNLDKFFIPEKTIGYLKYWNNDGPKERIPDLYDKLSKDGYSFMNKLTLGCGVSILFLIGKLDGVLVYDGSAVDCLTCLHLGIAKGYKIFRDIDISEPKPSSTGSDEYKGYYLILKK